MRFAENLLRCRAVGTWPPLPDAPPEWAPSAAAGRPMLTVVRLGGALPTPLAPEAHALLPPCRLCAGAIAVPPQGRCGRQLRPPAAAAAPGSRNKPPSVDQGCASRVQYSRSGPACMPAPRTTWQARTGQEEGLLVSCCQLCRWRLRVAAATRRTRQAADERHSRGCKPIGVDWASAGAAKRNRAVCRPADRPATDRHGQQFNSTRCTWQPSVGCCSRRAHDHAGIQAVRPRACVPRAAPRP